jgi:ankyrin repeat protein
MANDDERHELFVALLGAVDADDLEVQQQILMNHPALLAMSDLEGRTALHRAAGRGAALSLTHLISKSPDLGISNVSGWHCAFVIDSFDALNFHIGFTRSELAVSARHCTSAQASAAFSASRRCSNQAQT